MGKKPLKEIVNAIWSGAAVMAMRAGKTVNVSRTKNAPLATEQVLSNHIKPAMVL